MVGKKFKPSVSIGGNQKVFKRPARKDSKKVSEPLLKDSFPRDITPLILAALGKRFVSAAIGLKKPDTETIEIQFEGKRPLPKLPTGYYLKGSAPRELLRATFFPDDPPLTVRDLDVVRFRDTPDDQDHRISLQYMADDYQFGRGVEVVEDKASYFSSRDLTVNEVLFCDRTLEFTYQALRDLKEGVLRATPHITDAQGEVDLRITVKALRLVAESAVLNRALKLEGFPAVLRSTPFDIALHLDRALAIDSAIAEEYLFLVWKHGLLLTEREVPPTVVDAVLFLHSHLKAGADFFKNLKPAQLKALMKRLV